MNNGSCSAMSVQVILRGPFTQAIWCFIQDFAILKVPEDINGSYLSHLTIQE